MKKTLMLFLLFGLFCSGCGITSTPITRTYKRLTLGMSLDEFLNEYKSPRVRENITDYYKCNELTDQIYTLSGYDLKYDVSEIFCFFFDKKLAWFEIAYYSDTLEAD